MPQRPIKWLVINRLELAMETFERSLEPADDDDEDDAGAEADDEDDADTDEHEHGGQALKRSPAGVTKFRANTGTAARRGSGA